MKISILGNASVPPEKIGEFYIPNECELFVRGDTELGKTAVEYAKRCKLEYTEFSPRVNIYGNAASLMCDLEIINLSDVAVIFWKGRLSDCRYLCDYCRARKIEVSVISV